MVAEQRVSNGNGRLEAGAEAPLRPLTLKGTQWVGLATVQDCDEQGNALVQTGDGEAHLVLARHCYGARRGCQGHLRQFSGRASGTYMFHEESYRLPEAEAVPLPRRTRVLPSPPANNQLPEAEGGDPELMTMGILARWLAALDPKARRRVLEWAQDRFLKE